MDCCQKGRFPSGRRPLIISENADLRKNSLKEYADLQYNGNKENAKMQENCEIKSVGMHGKVKQMNEFEKVPKKGYPRGPTILLRRLRRRQEQKTA